MLILRVSRNQVSSCPHTSTSPHHRHLTPIQRHPSKIRKLTTELLNLPHPDEQYLPINLHYASSQHSKTVESNTGNVKSGRSGLIRGWAVLGKENRLQCRMDGGICGLRKCTTRLVRRPHFPFDRLGADVGAVMALAVSPTLDYAYTVSADHQVVKYDLQVRHDLTDISVSADGVLYP